jgi:tRNA(Ile)-lysidine synthase
MAADTRLSCRTTRIDVAAIAKTEHDNLESIARRERYGWLTQLARTEGATWIATGHNADDQAETVLFRLLRGSGVLGLAGMPECRSLDERTRLLRPLLPVPRQTILEYLAATNIPYRVDSSNRDLRFARNRIRLELMPQLQEHYNPAVVEVLCQLADQARELHAEIEVQARRLLAQAELPRAGDTLVFSSAQVQAGAANLVREMFRLVWQREGWPMGDMDFERWNRLADIAAGASAAWDFPGQIHARRIGKVVQLGRKAAQSS